MDSIRYSITQKSITDALGISKNVFKESIDNLMRVRLITSYIEDNEIQAEVDGSEEYYEASLHYGYHSVSITELGVTFVKVCTPSTDDENEEELLERLRKNKAIKEEQRKSALDAALKQIQEKLGKGAIVSTKESGKEP